MLKKMLKKGKALALAAVLSVTSVVVLDSTTEAAKVNAVHSVKLTIQGKGVTKKSISLRKGKKVTINVKVTPKKAKKSVTFQSSNKKVAKVSKKGVITAVKKGSAKITITVKGKNKKTKKTWMKVKVTEMKTNQELQNNASSSANQSDNKTTPASDKPSSSVQSIRIQELCIADGESNIYGKIYTPLKEGVYPAIIMCHGYNGSNEDFINECKYFAQNGYVAYAFDFCGGSGRSKSSGKSTEMTIFTEKSNLLAVFNHIKTLKNVDANNIFLFGGSQGGLVTALATEEVADAVKGMVLYFPAFNIPDDWRVMHPSIDNLPEVIPFWGLDLGKNFVISMHDFYTFDHIGKYPKNVLILYGAKDAIVPYSVIEKAKNTYQKCDLIVYPNDGHGFTPATAVKARQEVLKFMENNK